MRCIAFGIFSLVLGTGIATADATEKELEQATARCEKAIAKAEADFRETLAKAASKSKDRAAQVKLTYQLERFEKLKDVQTIAQAREYWRAREAALADLARVYEPAIRARRSGKLHESSDLFDSANLLERKQSELVKAARGFGLAVPDPEKEPIVVVRNVESGCVLEPTDPKGWSSRIEVNKYVRGKASQLWKLERGEEGISLKTAGGMHLHVPAGSTADGEKLVLWRCDERPTSKSFCWNVDESLREIVLLSALNGFALSSAEVAERGILKTYATQTKKAEKRIPSQVWKIEVVK